MANTRRITVAPPYDLGATLFALMVPSVHLVRRGPDYHLVGRNRDGPMALRLTGDGPTVEAHAYGPGGPLELDRLDALLGAADDFAGFDRDGGLLGELAVRQRGLRLGATGRMFEAAVPRILEQRVTGLQAKRSYAGLVRRFGESAPGPSGLKLPPEPEVLAALEYEDFHRHGVERSRAVIVREVARRARRIEEAATMDRDAAYQRLLAVRGIGEWTAALVMGPAWGDADAVAVGDFHLPNTVSWALAGEARGDDARMLELLEPYRPQRRRVILVLKGAGIAAPKFGARSPIVDISSI